LLHLTESAGHSAIGSHPAPNLIPRLASIAGT
jgi:hypothetical protein